MASYATILLALVVAIFIWYTLEKKKKRIPGPRGFPIIGYLPMMSRDLHLRFTEGAKKFGPIYKFRLGRNNFVIVNSPSLAKEVLRDEDASLANRYTPHASFVQSFGCQGVVWSPNTQLWRMNRKICVQELLSSTSLEYYQSLRRYEVRREISHLYSKSKTGTAVDVREETHATLLCVLMKMLWGATLEGEERGRVTDMFQQKMDLVTAGMAKPNVSDLFPILARFDLQGVHREMKELMLWFENYFDTLIDQRLKIESGNSHNKDFLQVLVDLLQNQDPKIPMDRIRIKSLLTDMLFAGIPTTSVMVEWTMAVFLKYPDCMKRAQEELDQVVGLNGVVEESHLPKLPYLHAVIKEVLRLYPFSPLVSPRWPTEACTLGGYTIPLGTNIFVNSWAIHRDPENWENPLKFSPERFLKAPDAWDFSGNDFRYIPFGSGRRGCAGIPMAEKTFPYLVASFIHSFNWRMPEGTQIDLQEKLEFNLQKKNPLVAIPIPRLSDPKLFT